MTNESKVNQCVDALANLGLYFNNSFVTFVDLSFVMENLLAFEKCQALLYSNDLCLI